MQAVEDDGVTMLPNGPSGQSDDGVEPFTESARRGGGRKRPPSEEGRRAVHRRSGEPAPSQGLMPGYPGKDASRKEVVDGFCLLVT